jgi:predicted DNA-binding transcriptional regulator YafY
VAIPKIERLLNLVAALMETPRPLSADTIRAKIEGYSGSDEAFRRTFERDKDELRSLGIPLKTVDTADGTGYRILPEDYELHDLGLDEEERAALAMAEAMVRTNLHSVSSAIAQLGGAEIPRHAEDATFAAGIATPPALQTVFDALAEQVTVRFTYGGLERVVEPFSLRYHAGNWYLDGFDDTRSDIRMFRLDRLESEMHLGAAPTERHLDLLAEAEVARARSAQPWLAPSEDSAVVSVRVDDELVDQVARDLPTASVTRNVDDTSTFSTEVSRWPIFRNYVAALLDHATVESPPELVGDMVAYLSECRDRPRLIEREAVPWGGERSWLVTKERSALTATAVDPGDDTNGYLPAAGESKKQRQTASDQLARILAIVPWVAANPGVKITEVCRRFDISPRQLTNDLDHLFMVGVPPYTPDTLINVLIEGGTITVHLGTAFTRPLRLSNQQILSLLIAGKAIREVPGAPNNDALDRALQKLAGHVAASDRLEVVLDEADAHTMSALRRAIDEALPVEMRYYSAWKDQVGTREISPQRLYAQNGHWYLDAHTLGASHDRTFRVDRMSAVRVANEQERSTGASTEEGGRPAAGEPEGRSAATGDGAGTSGDFQLVGIEMPAAQRWVLDQAYVESITAVGHDRLRVEIPVSQPRWLGRLLIQAGPDVEVRAPSSLASAGVRAAEATLLRYEARATP